MSKVCRESLGAGTSGTEDSSVAGASGHEKNGGASTSSPKNNNGVGTRGTENSCDAGATNLEKNSGARTSGSENRNGIDTRGPENSCVVGASENETRSGAGTGGPEHSWSTGTSCPANNSGASTSGTENISGASTRGPEDICGAGNICSVNSSDAVTKAYLPEPILPMSNTEDWFMEKRIDDISNKYKFDPAKRGKWVLCFAFDQMNEMWTKAYQLYSEGQLQGIQFVRTSTAKDARPDGGAIRFYCGPYDDENLVKSYGQNVVSFMNYSRQFGFISYKTDEQTEKETRSTFLYRLKVPRTERGCQDKCNGENEIDILKPMSITDQVFIPETIVDIHNRYEFDWNLRGRWTMYCRADTLDDAWRESCTLYRQEKLTGVQSLGAMTGKERPTDPKPIFFHCGPCSNSYLMMEYGRGIARQLGHFCSGTHLGYRVLDDETRTRLSKPFGQKKYLYTFNIRR